MPDPEIQKTIEDAKQDFQTKFEELESKFLAHVHNTIDTNPVDFNNLEDLSIVARTRGQLIYRGANLWELLGPGTSGQFLKTQGAGADPAWDDIVLETLLNYTAGEDITDGDAVMLGQGETILTPVTYSPNLSTVAHKFGRDSGDFEAVGQLIDEDNFLQATLKIIIELSKVGNPTDDIRLSIKRGSTTGTELAFATIDGSTLTTGILEYEFTLNTAFLGPDESNANYYFVIERSGALSDTDYYNVHTTSLGVKPMGLGNFQSFNGSSWSALNQELTVIIAGEVLNNNEVYRARYYAVRPDGKNFLGIASETFTDGNTGNVIIDGIHITSGLTPNSKYYLSTTTGGITTNAVTDIPIGVAESATELIVESGLLNREELVHQDLLANVEQGDDTSLNASEANDGTFSGIHGRLAFFCANSQAATSSSILSNGDVNPDSYVLLETSLYVNSLSLLNDSAYRGLIMVGGGNFGGSGAADVPFLQATGTWFGFSIKITAAFARIYTHTDDNSVERACNISTLVTPASTIKLQAAFTPDAGVGFFANNKCIAVHRQNVPAALGTRFRVAGRADNSPQSANTDRTFFIDKILVRGVR